jgi:hypothetical protein
MSISYLSRTDQFGEFDSIEWALKEHIKLPDLDEYHFGILYGNEDSPDKIELFKMDHPWIGMDPDFTWENGNPQEFIHVVSLTFKTDDNTVLNDVIRLVLGLKGISRPSLLIEYSLLRGEVE